MAIKTRTHFTFRVDTWTPGQPETRQILLAHHEIVPNIAWLPIGCRQA